MIRRLMDRAVDAAVVAILLCALPLPGIAALAWPGMARLGGYRGRS